jgi:hypothetical protein
MIEIPIWMLALIVFAIVILFGLNLEANARIRVMTIDGIMNARLVSQSFEDIAKDMDNMNDIIKKLEAEYEYKKISKVSD